MNAKQISEINSYYQRWVGKYYQMFGGLMVSLDDYKDQTLYLKLTISDRWDKRDALSTAFQMARSWRECIPEFRDAIRFESRCIYLPPGKPVGFVFKSIPDAEQLASEIAKLNAQKPCTPENAALRTVTISGLIDADIPCDLSPNREKSGLKPNYDEKAGLN
jgi:hypothetical protein